jgi:hypothetical protein
MLLKQDSSYLQKGTRHGEPNCEVVWRLTGDMLFCRQSSVILLTIVGNPADNYQQFYRQLSANDFMYYNYQADHIQKLFLIHRFTHKTVNVTWVNPSLLPSFSRQVNGIDSYLY